VYTVDAQRQCAAGCRGARGRIAYVGTDAGAAPFIGPHTKVIDLRGRMLMPGLVDGHSHPLQGGAALLKCSLNYEQLNVAQLQAKIQACLDQTRAHEPDGWLEVVNWFQEGMVPAGTATSSATLDALKTRRPILVASSFGHTSLVNSRALADRRPRRQDRRPTWRQGRAGCRGQSLGNSRGCRTGVRRQAHPDGYAGRQCQGGKAALDALRKQGVTTFLDAAAEAPSLEAFAAVQRAGNLTARAHFAVLITPPQGRDAKQAVAMVKSLAQRYDQGEIGLEPKLTVRNVKLFLDGVITAPASTGAMLTPYLSLQGAPGNPHWARRRAAGRMCIFRRPS
jgi:predicted amidohydrolase YtcJ